MRIVAIVQARNGSMRLPNKVMRPIQGRMMIDILLDRLARSRRIDEIVVATTDHRRDDSLAAVVEELGYKCFRGSEDDVLHRYQACAASVNADTVVRITGDCPLIDPDITDQCIEKFLESGVDYVSNIEPPTFPDGLDVEVFSTAALNRADRDATGQYNREHVTPFLRESGLFSKINLAHREDLSAMRWTVDDEADLRTVENIFGQFSGNSHFALDEVLRLYDDKPDLFAANSETERNVGSKMTKGSKLWNRAHKSILGGTMLLSKHPDMFLPGKWPTYFSKAKGCEVWDLDGTRFVDMSVMGVGTNVLGYGHDEVDGAVRDVVAAGNMSTLNCPEEVYLAERLLELNPWAGMVRFARSGGEANAVAVRIARAASGRDKVAICGYHGWCDWYLAANIASDDTLSGHLLPGLPPLGVPSGLASSILPFSYNRYHELADIVANNDVGVIFMEVQRNNGPEDDFLHRVRKLADDNGIVLVFDECTSGFRETDGGICKKYDVEPDMIVFGKTLGNGYAITAVVGRDTVMGAAQDSFISSTFWTERIGPSAALKTLEVMGRERSWEAITGIGNMVRAELQKLATTHDLKIAFAGIPALTSFSFGSKNELAYKTLIAQEMLKQGYLATNLIYASIAHTPRIIEGYIEAMDRVFPLIKACEDGRDPNDLLEGAVCRSGFKRLN